MPVVESSVGAEVLRERFPRVAVVHEWLTIPGGSEKVLEAILHLVPHAELFTSIYDPAPWPRVITDRPVHASFLNHVPGATVHYTRLLPFMDLAFRSFDLIPVRPRDLVQSRQRQERPHPSRRPSCVLLPHADALRVGPLAARGRGDRPPRPPARARSARPGCAAWTASEPPARTCSWRIRTSWLPGSPTPTDARAR